MAEKNPLEQHQKDYTEDIWMRYSIRDLGNWVHLFLERSGHRANKEKATKDLHDAKNYLWMIEQNLKMRAESLDIDFEKL